MQLGRKKGTVICTTRLHTCSRKLRDVEKRDATDLCTVISLTYCIMNGGRKRSVFEENQDGFGGETWCRFIPKTYYLLRSTQHLSCWIVSSVNYVKLMEMDFLPSFHMSNFCFMPNQFGSVKLSWRDVHMIWPWHLQIYVWSAKY